MNNAELAALPEALWEKYRKIHAPETGLSKIAFIESIKEAMQAQRKRDAEICREGVKAAQYRAENAKDFNPRDPAYYASHQEGIMRAHEEDAAAIEQQST